MTYPDVSGLPVNIDTTYADSTTDPSVKAHQQNHDLIHAAVKAVPTDYLTKASATATYGTVASVTATRRGPVLYVWNAVAYALAPGQTDDGVSPREYIGGVNGAPEAQAGFVARTGDKHFAVNP